MKKRKPKILVIVGPTASGKTSLSIALAKQFNGEIVSADSRQVYRGLDIGTGKVTPDEMAGVPHHLLDVTDPGEVYTAARFVRDGDAAIADITSRGKLPIVVGGTFLYIDTLLGKITTPDVPPNPTLRAALAALSLDALCDTLRTLDPQRLAVVDTQNRPRLIRAIEIATALGAVPPSAPVEKYDALTLGIEIDQDALHKNIHNRLVTRLETGMIEEVERLHRGGLSYERMEDLGLEYRYIARYLQGRLSYEDLCTEIELKSRQYAKRQMTWLKRSSEIVWVQMGNKEKIGEEIVRPFLSH